jgi:hypothetical protein
MARTKAQAVRALAESAKIAAVSPTRKQLAEELGPFKTCSVPTYVEDADGASQVNITSEQADPAENRRRWAAHCSALEGKRALETERSQRRGAEDETVTVFDARTGDERPVAPSQEANVARKPWARASRNGRKFFTGGWLGR